MLDNQRLIFDDEGTERDLSVTLGDFRTSTAAFAIVAVDDALYIGSDLPFNHKYILMGVANTSASVLSVALWWAQDWVDVANTIDGTSLTGKTFGQSGMIEFTPVLGKGWDRVRNSEDVTGIDVVGLYNLYWTRLTFSADFSVTTTVKYIGLKFSNDTELTTEYPDTARTQMMTAWATGKTDWNDQHFIAAEDIARDLRKNRIIMSSNQILNPRLFQKASIHRTAEIIYKGLGKAYDTQRAVARAAYIEAMNMDFFDVDTDRNGQLSDSEKTSSIRFGTR